MPVSDYESMFHAAGKEWNVDPVLLKAIAHQESGGNARSVSSAGAQGVMQIMPKTGAGLGLENPFDPEQSIYAGAKYMSQMLDQYKKPELALAAYNAGPARVDSMLAGKGTLPAETTAYVPAVTAHYQRFSKDASQGGKPAPADMASSDKSAPMPNDEFLKLTTPKAPEPTIDDFATHTGAIMKPPEAPAQPMQQTNPFEPGADGFATAPPADPSAAPVPSQGGPIAAVGRIANSVATAANSGAQGGEIITPEGTSVLRRIGIYPPTPGGGTMLQRGYEQIGDGISGGVNALGGLFRGGQAAVAQTGAELGAPQLGRDIAALPEAFPFGGPNAGMRGAEPPMANRLTPAAELPRASANPPIMPAVRNDFVPGATPEAANANRLVTPGAIVNDNAAPNRLVPANVNDGVPVAAAPAPGPIPGMAMPGAPETAPGARVADATPAPVAEPRPNSVGAAASSTDEANMSPSQTQAHRTLVEKDKLTEAQPPGPDNTDYIPGVQPTEAHMVQEAKTSRNEKLVASQMPDGFKEVARANNDVRVDHLKNLAGTEVQINSAEEARSARADQDLAEVWKNKKPADISGVQSAAADIMASPDGIRPAVGKAVSSVMDIINGKDGKPITDPEQLYGVRKHIDDLLSPEAAKDNPLSKRVTSQLLSLKSSLDSAIEGAAPKFRQYLDNFAEASRPIDEMKALQPYLVPGKAFDSSGKLTLSGVQRMMKDLVLQRSDRGLNPAKSITDRTMNELWAMRDDLRRVASSDELVRAHGSDSFSLFSDMAKKTAELGVHVAAGAAFPLVGNFIVNGVKQKLVDRSMRKDLGRALNPPNKLIPRDPTP